MLVLRVSKAYRIVSATIALILADIIPWSLKKKERQPTKATQQIWEKHFSRVSRISRVQPGTPEVEETSFRT